MATVQTDPNYQNTNQNQGGASQDNNAPQGAGAPPAQSGSEQSGGASGGSGAPSGATPAGTKSGSFTNLQSYLTANQGYNKDQGGLGGQVYQNLAQQGQNLQGDISKGYDTFNQQAQAATNQYDPTKTQSVLNDPSKYVSDPNNVASWQSQLSGAYTAPQYDANGQLASNAQNFQQTTNLGGSDSGRAALLQQLYGTPGYSTGQSSLDSLVMNANPTGLGQLAGAGQLGTDVNNSYNNNVGNAQATNQLNSATNQATGKSMTDLMNDTISADQSALQKQATDLQASRQNDYQNMYNQLASGNISPDIAQILGISPGTNTYGAINPANISNILTNKVGTMGIGNVANAQDQAKFQALAQLSGNSGLANYATPSGQPLGQAYDLSPQNAQQDISTAKANYTNELGQLLKQAPNSTAGGGPSQDPKQAMSDLQNQIAYDQKMSAYDQGLTGWETPTSQTQAVNQWNQSASQAQATQAALQALLNKYQQPGMTNQISSNVSSQT